MLPRHLCPPPPCTEASTEEEDEEGGDDEQQQQSGDCGGQPHCISLQEWGDRLCDSRCLERGDACHLLGQSAACNINSSSIPPPTSTVTSTHPSCQNQPVVGDQLCTPSLALSSAPLSKPACLAQGLRDMTVMILCQTQTRRSSPKVRLLSASHHSVITGGCYARPGLWLCGVRCCLVSFAVPL